ncbi:MAG: pyrimidine 5'-nucleotidase [Dichotomicrobium sp.]
MTANARDLAAFRNVDTWIFDLDNTLYPAESNLFAQVDRRMGEFIVNYLEVMPDEARRIQKHYYHTFGTTLAGLMKQHGVAPGDFLDYVHDIDLSPIEPAPDLAEAAKALPGKRYIFTNGSRRHAERVAEKLEVLHVFDGIFDIADSEYVPKPTRRAYDRAFEVFGADPRRAAMFEDLPHNLETPHALGMVTVLVHSSYADHPAQKAVGPDRPLPPHVHHLTDDLTSFLKTLRPVVGPGGVDTAGRHGETDGETGT